MTQTVKSLVQNLYKFIAVNDKERETETERGKERWRDREGRREKKRKEGGKKKHSWPCRQIFIVSVIHEENKSTVFPLKPDGLKVLTMKGGRRMERQ